MRILVAGWHGQVARALAEVAARTPEITAFAVGRPALDLSDSPSVGRTLFGISPDVVVNTAAYTDVEGAEAEPHKAIRQNALGAANLAARAAQQQMPIIHISTGHVFDGRKPEPYTEEDPPAPLNVYGRSKLDSELAVAAANPHHIILRTTWIYSPQGRNFVRSMLHRAQTADTFDLVDDQIGSPTYATHLAEAIVAIAIRLASQPSDVSWGTYHAAGTGTVSWHGLAEHTFAVSRGRGGPSATARPIKTADYPSQAARPMNSSLDCAKLENEFSLRLPNWQDGVEACVNAILTDGF